jgi:GTPase SAR1 family protein
MEIPNVRRIILCGASGVGKTSLCKRIAQNEFSDTEERTVGIGYFVRSFLINEDSKKTVRKRFVFFFFSNLN